MYMISAGITLTSPLIDKSACIKVPQLCCLSIRILLMLIDVALVLTPRKHTVEHLEGARNSPENKILPFTYFLPI